MLLATRANLINQTLCDSRLMADGCLMAGAGVPPTLSPPPDPSLTCSVENTHGAAGLQQNMSVHCAFFFFLKCQSKLETHFPDAL